MDSPPPTSYLQASPASTPTRTGSMGAGGGGGSGSGGAASPYNPHHQMLAHSSGGSGSSPSYSHTQRFPPPSVGGGMHSPRVDVVEAVIGTPESQHSVNALLVPVHNPIPNTHGAAPLNSYAHAQAHSQAHSHAPSSGGGSGSGVGSGPVLIGAGGGGGSGSGSGNVMAIGHASPAQLQLHSPHHQPRQSLHQAQSRPVATVRSSTSAQYGTPPIGASAATGSVFGIGAGTSVSGVIPTGSTHSQSSHHNLLRLHSPHSYASYLQPPQPTNPQPPRANGGGSPPLVPASSSVPHRGEEAGAGTRTNAGRRGANSTGSGGASGLQPLVSLQPDPHNTSQELTSPSQQQFIVHENARHFIAGRVLWTDSVLTDAVIYHRNRHPALAVCCTDSRPAAAHPFNAGRRTPSVCRLLALIVFALCFMSFVTIRWGCNQCPNTDDCASCLSDQSAGSAPPTAPYSSGVYATGAVASFRHALHPCSYCAGDETVPAQCFDAAPPNELNWFGIQQFTSAHVACPNNFTFTGVSQCAAAPIPLGARGGRFRLTVRDAFGTDINAGCSTPSIVYAVAASIAALAIVVFSWCLDCLSMYGRCGRLCCKRRHQQTLTSAEHEPSVSGIGIAGAAGGEDDQTVTDPGMTYTSIDADGHRIPRPDESPHESRSDPFLSVSNACRSHWRCQSIGHALVWYSAVSITAIGLLTIFAFAATRADQSTALLGAFVAVVMSWLHQFVLGTLWLLCRRKLQSNSDHYRDRPPPFNRFILSDGSPHHNHQQPPPSHPLPHPSIEPQTRFGTAIKPSATGGGGGGVPVPQHHAIISPRVGSSVGGIASASHASASALPPAGTSQDHTPAPHIIDQHHDDEDEDATGHGGYSAVPDGYIDQSTTPLSGR